MSGGPYEVGQTVELAFTLNSTATTAPGSATVALVVTAPSGADTVYSTGLSQSTPSSDSTSMGVARWRKLVTVTEAGRWRYQFRSTGTIVAAAGNAFAARGVFASTST